MQRGLGVLDIVVGEVPHQPAGEGRHVRQPGAAVPLENLPDGLSGVHGLRHGLRLHAVLVHPPDAQQAVLAGDLQRGGVAQEGIPAPAVVAGGALQQIAVTAGRPQRAHDLHRGEAIRQHLPADGNPPVIPDAAMVRTCSSVGYIIVQPPSAAGDEKTPSLTEFVLSCQGRGIASPRCHLASRYDPCPLRDTCISPATDVCPHVAEYWAVSRCSSRPLRSIWLPAFGPALSPPDSLCVH